VPKKRDSNLLGVAAGAHTVMIGSLFVGIEESPGEKFLYLQYEQQVF